MKQANPFALSTIAGKTFIFSFRLSLFAALTICFSATVAHATPISSCENEDSSFAHDDVSCVAADYDPIEMYVINISKNRAAPDVLTDSEHLSRGKELLLSDFASLPETAKASLHLIFTLDLRLRNVGDPEYDEMFLALQQKIPALSDHPNNDRVQRSYIEDMVAAFPALSVVTCPEYRSDPTVGFGKKVTDMAFLTMGELPSTSIFDFLLAAYLSVRNTLDHDYFATPDKNTYNFSFKPDDACLDLMAREERFLEVLKRQAEEAEAREKEDAGTVHCKIEWRSGVKQKVITYTEGGRTYAINGQARDRALSDRWRDWRDGSAWLTPSTVQTHLKAGLAKCP